MFKFLEEETPDSRNADIPHYILIMSLFSQDSTKSLTIHSYSAAVWAKTGTLEVLAVRLGECTLKGLLSIQTARC